MELSRKFDKILYGVVALVLVVLFGCLIKVYSNNTFAEGEGGAYTVTAAKFVTFYDDGQKLTVKTDAATVEEAID